MPESVTPAIAKLQVALAEEGRKTCPCFACRYGAALLDIAEAAERVLAWMANDRYTQLEKVDGGFELHRALAALNEVVQ